MKQATQFMKNGVVAMLVFSVLASSIFATPSQAAKKKAVLAKKKLTMTVGETKSIAIKRKKKGAKYAYQVKQKQIARVDKKGKITALKAGKTSIVVKEKIGKKTRTVGKLSLTVKEKAPDSSRIPQATPTSVPTASVPAGSKQPNTETPVNTPTNAPTETPVNTPTSTPANTDVPQTPTPTPVPLPTDLPAELIPDRETTAPGTHATASLPLIYSDIPDMDYIRVGEDYYMVSTTMFLNPGVPIMHSKDLVHWEIVSYVYDTLEDNDTTNLLNGKQCYGKGSWAASLKYNEGTYYVCFSSNDQAKTYIYTTDDIVNGTWKKHSASGTKHDPGLLFDEDKMYLICGNGNITLQEITLTENSIEFKGTAVTILKKSSSKNIVSIEGSHAYKIGEYYYLFFIEWPKNGKRMQWCYRSKSLTGDWEGKVVFCDDGNYSGAGIAQGGIVDTIYGDWYAILFQDHGAVGRTPVLLDVYWVDDWPMLGSEGGKASASESLDVNLEVSGDNGIYADDDFSYTENKLKLAWQWNHNPDSANWSVTEREGYLRLRTGSLASSIKDARNSLTQRTYGPACTSETCMDVSNMKNGDYAGICAFQNSYGQVGVMKDENGNAYIYYGSGTASMKVNDSDKVALNQNQVYLKVNYDFTGNKAKFSYSLDGTTWNSIGSSLSMTYDLTVFMGYRTYLYYFATEETGGTVDFDYYKIYS